MRKLLVLLLLFPLGCSSSSSGSQGNGNGGGDSGDGEGTCVFDPTVEPLCVSDAAGYTCSGTAVPTSAGATLDCSAVAGGGICCDNPNTYCNYDSMVSCGAGSVGFTCDNQAGETPEGAFPGVTCTVASSTDGTFCCSAK